MSNAGWFLVIGAVLLFMALTAARLERLPLSTAIVYLVVGLLLGPTFTNQFHFNPLEQSAMLEVVTEVAVLISLFAAGLKLATPVGDRAWWVPFRLATFSMVMTVGLTALVGMLVLNLPPGAAILLGAVLAPTDPVLATEVQVRGPHDDDRLRFALTGEAGLNDGTAFPMVMLGLGLLGLHDLGPNLIHWWLVDVLWASAAGLGVGALLGIATAHAVHRLAQRGLHSEFTRDFVGLGLIGLSYGASLLVLGYGFLAVFAAGFMFHRTELRLGPALPDAPEHAAARSAGPEGRTPGSGPFTSTISLLFVEQLERLTEVTILILVGGMLFADSWQLQYMLVAGILILLVRPVSAFLGLVGSGESAATKAAVCWFGVRGVGSFYYLMYAIQHGIETELAVVLISVVLVVVALSVFVHGVTVTPAMRLYARRH